VNAKTTITERESKFPCTSGCDIATSPGKVRSIASGCRYLVETGRATRHPFGTLRPLNQAVDRRRVRRALTEDELARLLEAARDRPLDVATEAARKEAARRAAGREAGRVAAEVAPDVAARLRATGEAHALLYAVAAGTGLRRGEVGRLRWADLDLVAGEVRVRAESAKARREQSVPLRTDLVAALSAERARRSREPGSAVVFPSRLIPTPRGFALDLLAAGLAAPVLGDGGKRVGIDATDEAGHVVDFHSLRSVLATRLSAAGVPLVQAQRILRHSSPTLTANHYTRPESSDLHRAIERTAPRLPSACPRTRPTRSRSRRRCSLKPPPSPSTTLDARR